MTRDEPQVLLAYAQVQGIGEWSGDPEPAPTLTLRCASCVGSKRQQVVALGRVYPTDQGLLLVGLRRRAAVVARTEARRDGGTLLALLGEPAREGSNWVVRCHRCGTRPLPAARELAAAARDPRTPFLLV